MADNMIAEKYTTLVSEKIPQVHEAGKGVGYTEGTDWMWRGIIGERTNFSQGFQNWQLEYMRPPKPIDPDDDKPIKPTTAGTFNQMFRGNSKLKIIESDYFDFSEVPSGSKDTEGLYYTFHDCTALEELQDVGIGVNNSIFSYYNSFYKCTNLKTINAFRVTEKARFSNTFNYCYALQDITIIGTIGQNGLSFQWSPLSEKSLASIVNALADKSNDTSATWTITLGNNKSNLTEDQINTIELKGWNIA